MRFESDTREEISETLAPIKKEGMHGRGEGRGEVASFPRSESKGREVDINIIEGLGRTHTHEHTHYSANNR